jgi:hypothetical protein
VGKFWASASGGLRAIIVLVGALLSLSIISSLIDSTFTSRASGPSGSSYSTAPSGVAAWATLLQRSGFEVVPRRVPLSEGTPVDPSHTLVVFGGYFLDGSEIDASKRHVAGGGVLVTDNISLAESIAGEAVPFGKLPETNETDEADETDEKPKVLTARVVPGVDGVGSAETIAVGARVLQCTKWSAVFTLDITLDEKGLLCPVARVPNAPSLTFIADSSLFSNQGLLMFDAADLAVSITQNKPVVFLETIHGYGERKGVAGLPVRWKWALAFLAAGTFSWMFSLFRRNGPSEVPSRDLPPARRQTIDAVAITLARSWKRNDPAAVPAPDQTSVPKSAVNSTPAKSQKEGHS